MGTMTKHGPAPIDGQIIPPDKGGVQYVATLPAGTIVTQDMLNALMQAGAFNARPMRDITPKKD